jgi:hypothetical protein
LFGSIGNDLRILSSSILSWSASAAFNCGSAYRKLEPTSSKIQAAMSRASGIFNNLPSATTTCGDAARREETQWFLQ